MTVWLAASCTQTPATTTSGQVTSTRAPVAGSTPPRLVVEEYLPGVEAAVLVPETDEPTPLVVMVPGGGWATADPGGLEGLGRALAGSGVMTAWVEIRAAEDEVLYPVPVEDVLCAVGFAAAVGRESQVGAGPVVVLGHSSGAHLAALAVLAVDDFSPACPEETVRPTALIGLAGPYDVDQVPDLAMTLFGAGRGEAPDMWDAGNPVLRAGSRPEVPVLLLHGEADDLVPVAFTTGFADALRDGGHDVSTVVIPGADHHEIYAPEVSSVVIAEWVMGLD